MNYSDYKCPGCNRMKHLPGMRPFITRHCPCSTTPVEFVRICWSKFDWSMTCQVLANDHGVPYHAVAAKRRALKKPIGKKGRKVRTDCNRRITPEEVDATISNAENARRFAARGIPVSAEWMRQLRLEKQQTPAS